MLDKISDVGLTQFKYYSLRLPNGPMEYKYVESARTTDFVALSKSAPLSTFVEIYQV